MNLRLTTFLALLTCTGCAGPTTPMGAVMAVHPSQVNQPRLSLISNVMKFSDWRLGPSNDPMVGFIPARQVLHAPRPLTVTIDDPKGFADPSKKVIVRHNGLDVTDSFLMQADMKTEGTRMTIRVPLVRLPAGQEHQIEVIYGKAGYQTMGRLEPPKCLASADRTVFSTEEFRPSAETLQTIHAVSREAGLNPVMTAALIAQESGFESKRVSLSRAIGLTQITTIADEELRQIDARFQRYPHFPGIHEMPIFWVQTMVATGAINENNEWRMHTERSIRGGVTYLKYLITRWNSPEAQELVQKVYGKEELPEATTRLVLASYNSGFSRVFGALERMEAAWPLSPDLKEARRYVGRVVSYCDHFADPEVVL